MAILVPGMRSASLVRLPAPMAERSLPMQCPDFWLPNIPFSQKEKPVDQPRSEEQHTVAACP